ncbi:hypothetical protein F5Y19DRAFT_268255 [Xylariaceae sp. FL1651]|nr:hypothetical protein F5Y19DRAFT_268255 [Xylariaceae sp. FL1651]
MGDEDLVQKVQGLGDLDLAALLCLISREHCIISTDTHSLDDLIAELQLVASRTFGLDSAVVKCTSETTLDDLVTDIQLPPPQLRPPTASSTSSPLHFRAQDSYFGTHHGGGHEQHGATLAPSSLSPNNAQSTAASSSAAHAPQQQQQQQQIANVILARDLDHAPKAVQIQCLELMRTRRIFTRTAVQSCPKQFLFIAVLAAESVGEARLTKHLNDHFYIAHWHDPEDGFAHLEEEEEEQEEVRDGDRGGIRYKGAAEERNIETASVASAESVVRRKRSPPGIATLSAPTPVLGPVSSIDWATSNPEDPNAPADPSHTADPSFPPALPLFTETDISTLSTLSLQTHVDIEVQRYQMNIIAFLRLHRAVTPGSVPPSATRHFRTLVRSLAVLHGLDFATPELVQLAARKIYAHHIVIVPPERERSMQWGSDLNAVKTLLEGVQPEDVVEDVLGMVDVPL